MSSLNLGVKLGNGYTSCVEYVAQNLVRPDSTVLEFGVWGGRTLRILSEPAGRAVGFDSFMGLPEDWRDGFPKGAFSMDGDVPSLDYAELVVGWFDDTAKQWVEENKDADVSVIHIDCDLYSSTVTVLEATKDFFRPGLIVVFDEYHGYPGWENGEYKAFEEFCEKYSVGFEPIGYGPEQFVVRIT